jgi:hypothetical protein
MSNGNGTEKIGPIPGAANVPNPVVMALEHALAAAKAGRVNSIGIIMVDPAGAVLPAWGGDRLGDIYLGCGLMQWRLMQVFHQPPPGRIVRVPGMPGL